MNTMSYYQLTFILRTCTQAAQEPNFAPPDPLQWISGSLSKTRQLSSFSISISTSRYHSPHDDVPKMNSACCSLAKVASYRISSTHPFNLVIARGSVVDFEYSNRHASAIVNAANEGCLVNSKKQ